MTQTMYALASALQAEADTVRVISQNIANAQTPAYRREIAVSQFDSLAPAQPPHSTQSMLDMRQGTLRSTGEPLNVAIEGGGFFVVQTDHGEVLTRRGDFRLDADGQLMTQSGAQVLGQKGQIRIQGGTPAIDPDGTVRVGDTVVDRLRVVDAPSASALQPAGAEGYELKDGAQPIDSSASLVRQGFLETSNVQPVNEMVQLMDTLRRFEAAQHFVRGYDGMIDEAINTLGKI